MGTLPRPAHRGARRPRGRPAPVVVQDILGRLAQFGRVKAYRGRCPDGNWMACCPAHADRTPSLAVGVGRDGVILHCFAGCDPRAVIEALGLTMGDKVFDARDDGRVELPPPKIVATYDYTTATGRPLYQVIRFEPKDFRQRRPLPRELRRTDAQKRAWVWGLRAGWYAPGRNGDYYSARDTDPGAVELPEAERVLYRLHHLEVGLKLEPRRMLFVTEGEKDADALHELGLYATTAAEGAGKWRGEYGAFFAGRNVCVVPDNDAQGEAHAAMIVGSVVAHHCLSVRVLRLPGLPPKGDVCDWIAAQDCEEVGQLRERFTGLVLAAEVYRR